MRRGFTLIELLVVMAIISILASILFPVFSRAIEKAKSTACLSNIKQIQMATMMYSQDYDGLYPGLPYIPAGGTSVIAWDDMLLPYTENKQIVACPTLQGAPVGYAINFWIIGTGGANAKKSAEKITFADATEPVSWYMFPVGVADPDPDGNAATAGSNPAIRHREGANFAFADGHAKWARPELPGIADFATGWDPSV